MTEHPIAASFENRNIHITIPGNLSATEFAAAISAQYNHQLLTEPVHVDLKFHFVPPTGLAPAKREMVRVRPPRRGWLDRAMRDTLDTCEGILWATGGDVAGAFGQVLWGEREEIVIRVIELPPGAIRCAELPEEF